MKEERFLITVQKLGRLANGFESDHGRIVHGLITRRPDESIQGGVAICGSKPNKRSVGWGKENKEITCEKCRDRIN